MNIVKLKAIYLADMTLETKNISDYIKKYFGKNYIIEQDKDLGWYNFKIGNKQYEDRLLQEINNKYKVYLKDGYWYLDLIAGYDLDVITQKEMGVLWNCITNLQCDLDGYKTKYKNAKENLKKLQEENKQLKEDKKKAIEYINKCRDYHKTYHSEDKMFADELTSLIMVLQ